MRLKSVTVNRTEARININIINNINNINSVKTTCEISD